MNYFTNTLVSLNRVTYANVGELFQACLQSYRMHVLSGDDRENTSYSIILTLEKDNLHYTSYVKHFRLINEENDVIKSSFEGRREHFVNLQIKNGETCNNGLSCTQTWFCSV